MTPRPMATPTTAGTQSVSVTARQSPYLASSRPQSLVIGGRVI